MTSHSRSARVVGLGPAGRIFAHRAAARGWQVQAFDPAGGSLPATIGLWREQLPGWVPPDLVAATFTPRVTLFDGTQVSLDRSYCVINNAEFAQLGGFEVVADTVDSVAETREPGAFRHLPGANLDIVATGANLAAASGSRGQPRQLAIGHIFHRAELPAAAQQPMLMDFQPVTVATTTGSPRQILAAQAAEGQPASFSYRIPLDEQRFLIEETIVAVAVAAPSAAPCGTSRGNDRGTSRGTSQSGPSGASGIWGEDALLELLRQRQDARLQSLGVDPARAIGTETVSFPLLRATSAPPLLTRGNPRQLAAGFIGGWMHPATGYSVGNVFAGVDDALDMAEQPWRRIFPSAVPSRASLAHRERGLGALLHFDAVETAAFFHTFFQLPQRQIFDYLLASRSLPILGAMVRLAPRLAHQDPALLRKLIGAYLRGVGPWRGDSGF